MAFSRTGSDGSTLSSVACVASPGSLTNFIRRRSLFWFLFAFGAVVLVLLVLVLPETLRSLVGNGSIPARGINRSLVSIWQDHRRRKALGDLAEPDAASLAARPPKKGWKDVQPFAPLKMFREKDVFLVLTFNAVCYTCVSRFGVCARQPTSPSLTARSLFYCVTTSTGTVFQTTYNLSESELGLCFLANGVGCLLATFINGPRLTADYKHVARQVEQKRLAEGVSLEEQEKQRKRDQNDLSTFPIEHARLRSMRASPPVDYRLTCRSLWLTERRAPQPTFSLALSRRRSCTAGSSRRACTCRSRSSCSSSVRRSRSSLSLSLAFSRRTLLIR